MLKQKRLCIEGVAYLVSYNATTGKMLAYERCTLTPTMFDRNPQERQQKRVDCEADKLQAQLTETLKPVLTPATWEMVTTRGEFGAN